MADEVSTYLRKQLNQQQKDLERIKSKFDQHVSQLRSDLKKLDTEMKSMFEKLMSQIEARSLEKFVAGAGNNTSSSKEGSNLPKPRGALVPSPPNQTLESQETKNSGCRHGRLDCLCLEGKIFPGGLLKVEQDFKSEQIAEEDKTKTLMMHLDGRTLQWHLYFTKSQGGLPIIQGAVYLDEMRKQFGDNDFSEPMSELITLKHTTTVDGYYDNFLLILNSIQLPSDCGLSNFIINMKLLLSTSKSVRLIYPKSLTHACKQIKLFDPGIIKHFSNTIQSSFSLHTKINRTLPNSLFIYFFFGGYLSSLDNVSLPIYLLWLVRTIYYYGDFDEGKQPPTFDQTIGGFTWNDNYEIRLNSKTFVSLTCDWAGMKFPYLVKQLHAIVIVSALEYEDYDDRLSKGLIQMYSLEKIPHVFDISPNRDEISLTSMIDGCLNIGQVSRACYLFNNRPNSDALLRVHAAIVNVVAITGDSDKKWTDTDREKCQIIVPSSQSANIIGKAGATINKLRGKARTKMAKDASGPRHSCAMDFDKFIQITGEPAVVKKALFAVSAIMYRSGTREEIPLETIVTEDPPATIAPFRTVPPILGVSHVPDLHGYVDTGSTWPVYSFVIPVVSGFSNASRPGELIIRILCPFNKIWRVISKEGGIIKSERQASGARIEVDDTRADHDEVIIPIIAIESPDDFKSKAIEVVLLLQGKVNDEDDNVVTTRLLVPSKVISCVIGKGDPIINEIWKPKKDVKNDIMSLFEQSNMVSPFVMHQQQLAVLAQQQFLLMAAAAKSAPGNTQLIINSCVKALEVIPQQLSNNVGIDTTEAKIAILQGRMAKKTPLGRVYLTFNNIILSSILEDKDVVKGGVLIRAKCSTVSFLVYCCRFSPAMLIVFSS